MRKLASIQKILNLRPIDGADFIEVADIMGWSVVVKRGDFQVGDLACYFEIDAWCDESHPAFNVPGFQERFTNWTDPDGKARRGMRLRTIKLRKQVSQGLVLPIISFPELDAKLNYKEGDDVTELLKIDKWEPHEEVRANGGPNKKAGAGKFPSFLRKTDQERVQNRMNELAQYADDTFEVSIKLDGSSFQVFHVLPSSPWISHIQEDVETRLLRRKNWWQKAWYKTKRKLGFVKQQQSFTGLCSRNLELDPDEANHFSEFYRRHNLAEIIEIICRWHGSSLSFQGELVAPSIQNNYEQVQQFEWYIFDIFDIEKQEYLKPDLVRSLCRGSTDFQVPPILLTVPILNESAKLSDFGPIDDPRALVDGILKFAEGPGMNRGVKREGVVLKSNTSEWSAKAISNAYLLKKAKEEDAAEKQAAPVEA